MGKSNRKLVVVPIGPAECADRLGCVKADISDLNKEAEGYKAVLIAAAADGPESVFEGEVFRASVSFVDRAVYDYRAMIDEIVANHPRLKEEVMILSNKYCKIASGLPVVKVSARK